MLTLWPPVAIYLPVKHRGTWDPRQQRLCHSFITLTNHQSLAPTFEWQLKLGGPVANMLPHFCKYADALRPSGKTVATRGFWLTPSLATILPQIPKRYSFVTLKFDLSIVQSRNVRFIFNMIVLMLVPYGSQRVLTGVGASAMHTGCSIPSLGSYVVNQE